MGEWQQYETEWDGLRLVIEERPRYFQVIIYDRGQCEVLYTAERMNLDAAKFAAVDFAMTAHFGPSHHLKSEVVAAMLVWQTT